MKILELWVEKVPIMPSSKVMSKIAHIVVQSRTTGPEGEIRISAECRAAKEVDEWADYLIRELQAIKIKSKKSL